ncbi:hypothetical protein PR048_013757 [Dryococelus australis]|uniref:PiggyBac transposable element-derived protein domain-containing protein n=1 Tax=Dryococelus australis TaxID=614101 RepID=A0ABQ9HTX6_9NEOP|nr:hypothetical protein PR048_013757 [Dryococelus australis]
MVDNTSKVAVVMWSDNKAVHLSSSYVDVYPVSTIRRYQNCSIKHASTGDGTQGDQDGKKDVQCSQIVKHYDAQMGERDMELLGEKKPEKFKVFRLGIVECRLFKSIKMGRPSSEEDRGPEKRIKTPVVPRPHDEKFKDCGFARANNVAGTVVKHRIQMKDTVFASRPAILMVFNGSPK